MAYNLESTLVPLLLSHSLFTVFYSRFRLFQCRLLRRVGSHLHYILVLRIYWPWNTMQAHPCPSLTHQPVLCHCQFSVIILFTFRITSSVVFPYCHCERFYTYLYIYTIDILLSPGFYFRQFTTEISNSCFDSKLSECLNNFKDYSISMYICIYHWLFLIFIYR